MIFFIKRKKKKKQESSNFPQSMTNNSKRIAKFGNDGTIS